MVSSGHCNAAGRFEPSADPPNEVPRQFTLEPAHLHVARLRSDDWTRQARQGGPEREWLCRSSSDSERGSPLASPSAWGSAVSSVAQRGVEVTGRTRSAWGPCSVATKREKRDEFAGDHRSRESQIRFLSRRHRCIVYAARGYPPSDAPTNPTAYSQDLAVADSLAELDHLRIERAHVVGLWVGAFCTLLSAWATPVGRPRSSSPGADMEGIPTPGRPWFDERQSQPVRDADLPEQDRPLP